MASLNCLQKARERFTNKRIPCMKYNHALEDVVQNFSTYQSYIQLKDNQLLIVNKKPVDNQEYVLEADPAEVE